jgi:hypothetical protein
MAILKGQWLALNGKQSPPTKKLVNTIGAASATGFSTSLNASVALEPDNVVEVSWVPQ